MTAHRSPVRRAAAATAVTAAALVLAACGSSNNSAGSSAHDMGSMPSASSAASQGTHNAQDMAFAQSMLPHHRQAVTMAHLVRGRASSPAVKELATQIEKAQGPEITTMSGWLKSWGKMTATGAMPTTKGMKGMEGMDHSGARMPGMMSDADMRKLENLSGPAFDTAFLQMMIDHHRGAIDMARTEQAKGAYGPAKALAKSIVTSQSAEITRMNRMLNH